MGTRRIRLRPLAVGILVLALAVPFGVAGADEDATTEWLSEDSGSVGGRELPAVSADGRYVVFVGRSSADMGVWLRDRVEATTRRLTTGSHFNPAISADGRLVAYAQYGASGQGVYVLDWRTPGATPEQVSLADDGSPATVPSDFPALSAAGRYVAFQASTDDLDDDALPGKQGGGPSKVYVRDRLTDETTMASVTSAGEIANGNANRPDMTPDGRFVVFSSDASELAGGEPPEEPTEEATEPDDEEATVVHVYRHDLQTGETVMASVASDATPADASSATAYGPTISDDGTRVAFESDATNLVVGDTNDNTDAFVRDMAAETTIRVSVDAGGAQVTLPNPVELPAPAPTPAVAAPPTGDETTEVDQTSNVGVGPAITGDGMRVAFESDAALTEDDTNTPEPPDTHEVTVGSDDTATTWEVPVLTGDVYVREFAMGGLARASIAVGDGVEATGLRTDGMGTTAPANNGADPGVGSDGRLVGFVSNGNLDGSRPEPEEDEHEVTVLADDPLLWEPAVWGRFDPSAIVPDVVRDAGANRVATAVAISQHRFPDGAATVVLARSDTYPDALGGGPLAAALGAPILLTSPTGLSPATATEIERLGAHRAVVLGGTGAVGPVAVADLGAVGITDVDRIGGATRFVTAALVAAEVVDLTASRHAFVTEGWDPDPARGWPDAVSVSGLAAFAGDPILLVTTSSLPAATAGALASLGIDDATVVGGTAAVSSGVAGAIDGIVGTVDRLAGATRYATSVAVADASLAAGASTAQAWIATGRAFPDALAAGPVAGAENGVLLLVDGLDLANSATSQAWLAGHDFGAVHLVGGTAAISVATEAAITGLVE